MSETDKSTAQELRRRIAVYDELEATGNWQGRMSGADYLGLLLLTLVLVVGSWMWGR